ncbi:MAG: hypothetical protein ACM3X5_04845 [Bacillota bacterium]
MGSENRLAVRHYNLGVMKLRDNAPLDAVEAEFRRALELDPAHADAMSNLGATLFARGLRQEALRCFRDAVRLRPREPRYLRNLARNLMRFEELHEASGLLKKLAELDRANAGAYLLSEALLVPQITPDEDFPARVRKRILQRLGVLMREDHAIADPLSMARSYFPLSYHGVADIEVAKAMAQLYLKWLPALAWTSPHIAAWRRPEGRIRVGLASRYFRNYGIGNTSRGLIEQLDRDRFEAIVIRLEPSNGDENAVAIDKAADRVLVIAGRLQAAREQIAELRLDILFFQDVGLEPLSYFLAFARLAPVQVVSFGHPDTTGIPNMDYFISARLYELPGAQRDYSERLVEIPDVGTLSYYHRPAMPAEVASRAELAIDPSDRIYFCPQSLQKVQPAMDRIFARIAQLDGDARIVLIEFEEHQRRALEARFGRLFQSLLDRVRFVPRAQYAHFLARLACADVLLDTVHFNGQNSTLEAFAMGMPVVTLPGRFQRARHGYGLYTAMGFTDLIATDPEDYARKAVRVANDRAFRDHCRERIAASCGVLFEDRRFVRHCEQAFIAMIEERAA